MKTQENVQVHQTPMDLHLLFGMLRFEIPEHPDFGDIPAKEFAECLTGYVGDRIDHQVPNKDYESEKPQIFFIDTEMAEAISKAAVKVHTWIMEESLADPSDEVLASKAHWGRQLVYPWVEAVALAMGDMDIEEAVKTRKEFKMPPRVEVGNWDDFKEMEAN